MAGIEKDTIPKESLNIYRNSNTPYGKQFYQRRARSSEFDTLNLKQHLQIKGL